MKNVIDVIGEDRLCCALGERMVGYWLPNWRLPDYGAINKDGVSKLEESMDKYRDLSRLRPVFCLSDSDGICPVQLLLRRRPVGAGANLIVRFAIKESETWVMADRHGFAGFLGVPVTRVPTEVDKVEDPKMQILHLARGSSKRAIRQEVVSGKNFPRKGPGYNLHIAYFVKNQWSPVIAANNSASLSRAVRALQRLGM